MATKQQQAAKLQAQAQEYVEQVRKRLMALANSGNPRAFSHGLGRGGDRGFTSAPRGGGFQLQYGATPTDAQVMEFIARSGGNPYVAKLRQVQAAGRSGGSGSTNGRGSASTAPAPTPSLYDQLNALKADYEAKLAEANRKNEERYAEGKGELGGVRERVQQGYAQGSQALSDLHARNMARVGNWGIAQAQLNEERAREALGAQTANLAARGLGNSTILPSYQQRNARDLALVQQDLSERRDQRFIDADTQGINNLMAWNERGLGADARDTGNLVGFIERRNDVGPDPNMFMQLANQLGQASAAQQAQANWEKQFAEQQRQFNATQQLQRSMAQMPYGSYAGYGQRGAPVFLNGSPLQMAGVMAGAANAAIANYGTGPYRSAADIIAQRAANHRAMAAQQRAQPPAYVPLTNTYQTTAYNRFPVYA